MSEDAKSQEEARRARVEIGATLARMQSSSRQVRNMLREGRKHGTSRQISCLDEALSRADVAHRMARDQESETLAAYARGDLANARASRLRIVELDEAQRWAVRDGSACIPQTTERSSVKSGTTTVRMVVDPRIPAER